VKGASAVSFVSGLELIVKQTVFCAIPNTGRVSSRIISFFIFHYLIDTAKITK
jgi:hypothetical protein